MHLHPGFPRVLDHRLVRLPGVLPEPLVREGGEEELVLPAPEQRGALPVPGTVVLVGDETYYARAGFARIQPMGRITLPGPVDLSRVLGLELEPGALDGVAGELCKRGVAEEIYAAGARLSTFAAPASQ